MKPKSDHVEMARKLAYKSFLPVPKVMQNYELSGAGCCVYCGQPVRDWSMKIALEQLIERTALAITEAEERGYKRCSDGFT